MTNKQNKNWVVCGMGMGDEGKGTITDYLVHKHDINLVIRYSGGGNAGHNVVQPDGRWHQFSQFGSGTFKEGCKTLLSKYVLFDPLALELEEQALQKVGVTDAYSRLYVDENALVVTPFHIHLNKCREASRHENVHGTCAKGIGETASFALDFPEIALRVNELFTLSNWKLANRLKQIEDYMEHRFELIGYNVPEIEIGKLAIHYKKIAAKFKLLNSFQVKQLLTNERAVFEGSQGALLDENYGFHPHTTWSTTTAHNAVDIHQEVGLEEPTIIGVARTYATRHGAGPFPTEHDEETAKIFKPFETHSVDDCPSGTFRTGWLDLVLLRYAISVNPWIDCLAVTHLDLLEKIENWQICEEYNQTYRMPIPVSLKHQENLTKLLFDSEPLYYGVEKKDILSAIIYYVNLPIKIRSFGPTWKDKSDNL